SADIDASGRVIFDYAGATPFNTLRSQIVSGYNGGLWNGPGINSSAAAADPTLAVGYAESSSVYSFFPATYSGESIDSTAVLVRLTKSGDADLNGTVDTVDFNLLAASFGQSGKSWFNGD